MASPLQCNGRRMRGLGPGAWAIGVTSLSCFLIALYAVFNGTKYITRSDCLFFGAALAAIPLWHFSHDSLWILCLAVGIDFCAYYPTIRKAYILPYDENATCFAFCILRDFASLAAIRSYSILTMLYPVVFALTNGFVVVMIVLRRRVRKKELEEIGA